ncbi:MAG: hypothetical protein ACKV0T_08415 [Planctomycetales bacterium]
MKRFQFTLESLLQWRRSHRDARRQALASALHQVATLQRQQEALVLDHNRQQKELRRLSAQPRLDVPGCLALRSHLEHLAGELEVNRRESALAAENLEQCRAALVEAEQAVKGLEKLSASRQAELILQQERQLELDQEEAWRALSRNRAVTGAIP